MKLKKIIIVGAGPSGIGFGILLKQLGIEDFLILEKDIVGSTFFKWPKEMKLITPSFTGHGFGLLDLNAITPDTSPAYTFDKEHLTGEDYGSYLELMAEHFDLPIYEEAFVHKVVKEGEHFKLTVNDEEIVAENLVWATGEFQFPRMHSIEGAELSIHNSQVRSWGELQGDEFIIIGGYESGIDAAYHLVKNNKKVTVLSRSSIWNSEDADPSLSLSPYTKERLLSIQESGQLNLVGNAEVVKITKEERSYFLHLVDGTVYQSKTQPILATGFLSGANQIQSLFEWEEDGVPALTEQDESTITSNLFLLGPNVRHKQVIFCFIYKFRQRFAVVAKEILDRSDISYKEEVFEK